MIMEQVFTPRKNSKEKFESLLDQVLTTSKKSMQLSPEVFNRMLPKAVHRNLKKQLLESVNMMKYQNQGEDIVSSDDERTFSHSKKHWKEYPGSTNTYIRNFPAECKPMKHFLNFSPNYYDDPEFKKK
jgi:hypothetical protein